MVSVTKGSCYHTDVCLSVLVSGKFGFILLFDTIQTVWNLMTDSWDLLVTGQACLSAGRHHHSSIPQSLLLSLQMCEMAAFISRIFGLNFWKVEESADVLSFYFNLWSFNYFILKLSTTTTGFHSTCYHITKVRFYGHDTWVICIITQQDEAPEMWLTGWQSCFWEVICQVPLGDHCGVKYYKLTTDWALSSTWRKDMICDLESKRMSH